MSIGHRAIYLIIGSVYLSLMLGVQEAVAFLLLAGSYVTLALFIKR